MGAGSQTKLVLVAWFRGETVRPSHIFIVLLFQKQTSRLQCLNCVEE